MAVGNSSIQSEQEITTGIKLLNLRTLSLLLVAIGVGICGYLSYAQTFGLDVVCTAGGEAGCDIVQNSIYAEMFGIKIAYLGLLGYLAIGALILFQDRLAFLREYGPLLTFSLVLFSFLYSVYLVYIQAAVLQAFCQWCLGHEVVMTVLFVITAIRTWGYYNRIEED
jgi:uncharacterized membrane protein